MFISIIVSGSVSRTQCIGYTIDKQPLVVFVEQFRKEEGAKGGGEGGGDAAVADGEGAVRDGEDGQEDPS